MPILALTFAFLTGSASAFTLHTDFPGGSAEVRALDAAAGQIEISPSHHEGRGWPCWWYFRVDGATTGQKLTLVVSPSERPFRAEARLAAMWSLPAQPAISVDDVEWSQIAPGEITQQSGRYEITAPAERFWLAWGPPFLPSHAQALLEDTAGRVPGAELFELARTLEGRAVNGIRLGRAGAPLTLWVQARQHAWESGGSWVGQGFLKWICGDDPAARQLREDAELFFIPIMDVDNVVRGAGGKEAVPRDHNRDWADPPVYPEVAAAQTRLLKLIDAGRLRLFLDLHNPGPRDKTPFFFGPMDFDELTGTRRQTYERFLRLAVENMTEPLAIHPSYRFANYVKTEEERGRMSGNWMRNRTNEKAVAMTLETSWNTPHSTVEGYLEVGRKLGITVARFVAEP